MSSKAGKKVKQPEFRVIPSSAQRAYDEANAAYQAAWRGNANLQKKLREAERALLGLDSTVTSFRARFAAIFQGPNPTMVKFFALRDELSEREQVAAALLVQRDIAYKALLASPEPAYTKVSVGAENETGAPRE